jgi:hypothetical protein
MAKAEATVEELVSTIERGELRLPEMLRCIAATSGVPPGCAICSIPSIAAIDRAPI